MAVRVEGEAGVLIITIDRPEARNTVNREVADGIATAMDRLDGGDDQRAGVLAGAGGTFCAGMDLKAFAAGEVPRVEGRGFAGIVRRPPRKPLIAAVEGWAGRRLRGGAGVRRDRRALRDPRGQARARDRRRRADPAPAPNPLHLAMELALTGDPVGAERAQAMGVVSRLTEPGEALSGARELAAAIAANGPLAVDATKRILSAAADWAAAEAWDRQAEISDPVLASEDARGGAAAFAKKRPPVWKGR